jgi:hypothetical protein
MKNFLQNSESFDDLLFSIGQDTRIHQVTHSLLFVSVHLSNNRTNFIKQIKSLRVLISSMSCNVVVSGDFNASVIELNNEIIFLDKFHSNILITKLFVEGRKHTVSSVPFPTSSKTRLLTTQFNKMLKLHESTIDNFFLVSQNVEQSISVRSNVTTDVVLTHKITIPPHWPSDHFILDTLLTISNEKFPPNRNDISSYNQPSTTLRFVSWNILGESISNKEPFNIFEFLTVDITEYESELIQSLRNIHVHEFLQSLLPPFPCDNPNTTDLQALFLEGKGYSKYLRNVNLFQCHLLPYSYYEELNWIEKYESTKQVYDIYLNKLLHESLITQVYAHNLLSFYNTLYTHPDLHSLWRRWLLSIKNQSQYSFIDVLITRMEQKVTVVALQEVSLYQFEMIKTQMLNNSYGYELIPHSYPERNTKTIGVILYLPDTVHSSCH